MWKHQSRLIQFCLCVDNFRIKYVKKTDISHLIETLQARYKITVDWTGSNYCGLTLNWNYAKQYVNISIPGYIEKLLTRLAYKRPSRPTHAPHQWSQPVFGRHTTQPSTPADTSPPLPHTEIKLIQ